MVEFFPSHSDFFPRRLADIVDVLKIIVPRNANVNGFLRPNAQISWRAVLGLLQRRHSRWLAVDR